MAYVLSEKDIRFSYEYYGLKWQWCQLHCQNLETGKTLSRQLVSDESSVVEWARNWNGKGQIWVGHNGRMENGVVSRITSVTIDLDPIDKKGSEHENRTECLEAGRAILKVWPGGSLASSGTGALVVYTAPQDFNIALEPFPDILEAWTKLNIQPIVSKFEKVRLDPLYDNERLNKLVGTISCKSPRRLSKFVLLPNNASDGRGVFDSIQRLAGQQPGLSQSVVDSRSTGHGGFAACSGHIDAASGNQSNAAKLIPAAQGLRHNYLVSVAGTLRRKGLEYGALYKAVKAVYETSCETSPPFPDEELRTICRSMGQYAPDDVGAAHRELNGQFGGGFGSAGYSAGSEETVLCRPDDASLTEYENVLLSRSEGKKIELPTGFKRIDELTDGYLRGDLFVLGANTGAGKSTWFLNSANSLCRAGKKVLYLSTELSHWQVYDKLFALNTGIEYKKFRKGWLTDEEKEKKDLFKKEFSSYQLLVNDILSPSIEQIRDMLAKEKPDVVVLDHIHQIGSGSNNLYGVLSRFTNDLKKLASEFNVAVAIAAQFGRPERMMDKESGEMKIARKPTLYDFKACGEIENRASTALLMHDTKASTDLDTNLMGIEIAKCRHGDKGLVEINWLWKLSLMQETIGG